ncbi:MAG: histidinol-phosphatase HisJ family protein, partial [Acidaminococcaceae bacterium]|nr:histidinol-phosphatase HisJ family protein [Acidaminococcaceae bacterium]
MEAMIQAGIQAGLQTMCFTEHNDFAMPSLPDFPPEAWLLNVDSYLYELISLKEKYADQIRILFGVELGFQTKCMREDAVLAKSHDFDFIIGSTHIVRDMDPYYPMYFEGRSAEEAYHEYFEDELTNLKKHSNFDVYGHLDYVVRYGGDPSTPYNHDL